MNVNVDIDELRRLVKQTDEGMSRDVAGVVVNLRLTPAEVRRMDQLMRKSKGVGLGNAEEQELRGYADLTDLLAVLRLRAGDRLAPEIAGAAREAVA